MTRMTGIRFSKWCKSQVGLLLISDEKYREFEKTQKKWGEIYGVILHGFFVYSTFYYSLLTIDDIMEAYNKYYEQKYGGVK